MTGTNCIFCRANSEGAAREHLLPESLGGGDWAVLVPGLVCSDCNNYFSTAFERQALDSFPLLALRVFGAVKTKKERYPHLSSLLGEVYATDQPAVASLDPAGERLQRGISDGSVRRLTIPYGVSDPLAVCRLLLKIGIELVALDSRADAESERLDAARQFVRAPTKGARWWFVMLGPQSTDALSPDAINGSSNVRVECLELEGTECVHLRLGICSLIAPLEESPHPTVEVPEPALILYPVTV